MITQQKFESLLLSNETENLEFKEAKQSFDKEKLIKYCVALSNEMGGIFVLGVSDKLPRRLLEQMHFKTIPLYKKTFLTFSVLE